MNGNNGREDILLLDGITKTYRSGQHSLDVLKKVTLSISEGSTVSIIGPSGSGKSTLLGICAGLDKPTQGSVRLCGERLEAMTEDERALHRNRFIGFVFQNYQLIPTLTALENVMVPIELVGASGADDLAAELLQKVGLGERLDHYPVQLSGGEQQRVALARAFINKPKILFADEPTGNLDTETGESIVELLFELNRDAGTTLVLVTHNLELARRADRIIPIRNGELDEIPAS